MAIQQLYIHSQLYEPKQKGDILQDPKPSRNPGEQ